MSLVCSCVKKDILTLPQCIVSPYLRHTVPNIWLVVTYLGLDTNCECNVHTDVGAVDRVWFKQTTSSNESRYGYI